MTDEKKSATTKLPVEKPVEAEPICEPEACDDGEPESYPEIPENPPIEFFEDYRALQGAFEPLKKETENTFYSSKYVTLNQVLEAVKKNCAKHNFIFFQVPKIDEFGKPILETTLLHQSGEKLVGQIPLVAKDPNDPQKIGGAVTYMRRYSLAAMFGLEDEDDDGNNASTPSKKPENPQDEKPQVWFDPKNESHIKSLQNL